jgi:anaerobic magnesium-protoporphyrin IX monomethyl ester cyclase
MAISYGQLEEFAELWHDELALPFAVYGVIPNYVRQDKLELLSWAGMNHIRMGIQSGSKNMLDFYKRRRRRRDPRAGVKSTLQLLYLMDRPYTLFIYSLKVIRTPASRRR